jgi:hypothetical protein
MPRFITSKHPLLLEIVALDELAPKNVALFTYVVLETPTTGTLIPLLV